MCSRFSTNFPMEELLLLAEPDEDLGRRNSCGDARPGTEQLGVLFRNKPRILPMTWGWSLFGSPRPIINCRLENAAPSGTWYTYLEKGRCLLPLSAWWEKDRKGRKTWWTFRSSEKLFFLGGLFYREGGLCRFSLLTRPAEETVLPVHPRMPLPFSREEGLRWLQPHLPMAKVLEMARKSTVPLRKEPLSHPAGEVRGQGLLFSPSPQEEEGEHTR